MKILVYNELTDTGLLIFLAAQNYNVEAITSYNSLRAKITDFEYEACLLILKGSDKCRPEDVVALREFNKVIPIMVLCAGSIDYEYAIRMVNHGVDRFYFYPTNTRLIIAEMEALMNRTRQFSRVSTAGLEFKLGGVTFYPDNKELVGPTGSVGLTYKETAVLTLLCRANGKYVSRSSILKIVWYGDTFYNGRNYDVMLCKLRKKLRSVNNEITIINDCSNYKLILVKDGDKEQ